MFTMRVLLCIIVSAVFCAEFASARFCIGIRIRTRRWRACIGIGFSKKLNNQKFCQDLERAIITRDQWKAIPARNQVPMTGRAEEVIVWHTGQKTCEMIALSGQNCDRCLKDEACMTNGIAAIQDYDLRQELDDIRYNFLIDERGIIYEGRGWDVVGQHTEGHNALSTGVALIGDYSSNEPTQATQDALNNLILCGKHYGKVQPNALLFTDPDKVGKAFFDMVERCNGLCVVSNP